MMHMYVNELLITGIIQLSRNYFIFTSKTLIEPMLFHLKYKLDYGKEIYSAVLILSFWFPNVSYFVLAQMCM